MEEMKVIEVLVEIERTPDEKRMQTETVSRKRVLQYFQEQWHEESPPPGIRLERWNKNKLWFRVTR